MKPFMTESLTRRYIEAFKGLSYSDLSTATKNALCTATLRGEAGFTRFDIVHETFVLQHHGIENRDEYVSYLLMHGCTIKAVHENTGIPRRVIQGVSKRLNGKEA